MALAILIGMFIIPPIKVRMRCSECGCRFSDSSENPEDCHWVRFSEHTATRAHAGRM
jgi:hypothetical protein